MLWPASEFPSCVRLNNITVYVHSSFCVSTQLLIDTWAVQVPCSSSFGHIPRSGIAESHGDATFQFLRNFYTIFPSNCTILHSCKRCTKLPISLHPHHLFSAVLGSFIFFIMAIFTIYCLHFTICFLPPPLFSLLFPPNRITRFLVAETVLNNLSTHKYGVLILIV